MKVKNNNNTKVYTILLKIEQNVHIIKDYQLKQADQKHNGTNLLTTVPPKELLAPSVKNMKV